MKQITKILTLFILITGVTLFFSNIVKADTVNVSNSDSSIIAQASPGTPGGGGSGGAGGGTGSGGGTGGGTGSGGGTGGGTGSGSGPNLENPLGSDTIIGVINKIISGIRDVIAPPLVAIIVLYGGFLMMFAGGDEEKFSKGKKAITYAIAGYVIILISSGIASLLKDILGA